ncbi:MAG: TonB-dependent receptor [Putridiphycobacter sp.]
MSKYFILSLLFSFFCLESFGQQVNLSGKLSDTDNNPLQGEIKIFELQKVILSDQNGNFSVEVAPNQTYTIVFRALNHVSAQRKVKVNATDINLGQIKLKLKTLKPVVVKQDEVGMTIEKIKPPEYGRIPTSTGNFEDYLKVSGLGISSNNELTSNYNVRGGNYDENLIYVNGIQIYRPFLARSGQQEGLSFINTALVDNIYFSAGGFDAYYGDKLASVLDIRYREPNSFKGSAQVSLMGVQAHVENVFGKSDRGNFITGARYRANAYLLNSLPVKGDYKPTFFDYQFFANYYTNYDGNDSYQKIYALGHFSTNNYLFVPSTRSTEFGTVNEAYQLKIYYEGQEQTKFQTFTGALGYQWKVNKHLDMHLVASSFNSKETEYFDILGQYYINQLETDPAKEEYGDSTSNIGVGGILDHGRNDLNVWISNLYYYGIYDFNKKINEDNNSSIFSELRWGTKFQHELFDNNLSEWHAIDSAGYIIPQGNPTTVELDDVIKQHNIVTNNRVTAHVQYNFNKVKRKTIVVNMKRKIKTDTSKYFITKIDTLKKSPNKWAVSLGVRGGYRSFNDEFWVTPRFNISYTPRHYILNEDTTINRRSSKFKFATGLYYQPPLYRALRAINGTINPEVVSQKSWHNVFGYNAYFKMWGRPFKFTTEAYYKYLWDVNPYEIDNVRIRYFATNNAIAHVYGIDAKINGEFIKGVESSFKLGILRAVEDILDDSFTTYINSDGDTIIPGYSANNVAVDSFVTYPGNIPRPTDQLVNFSVFFQDQMPKFDRFKISVNILFGTPLPFGPPTFERYKDVLRTKSYFRTDIGLIFDIINKDNYEEFEERPIFKHFNRLSLSLNAFNLMGINNVISYDWTQDIYGRYFAVPNHLTGRRLNLKLVVQF